VVLVSDLKRNLLEISWTAFAVQISSDMPGKFRAFSLLLALNRDMVSGTSKHIPQP
jgi:hypothetical protein